MPRPPAAPTHLKAKSALLANRLAWTPLDWSTMVDHYRVHGVPTSRADHRFAKHPGDDTLLAKTVYPAWDHTRRSAKGETWTYVIVTVDAAGTRSKPSAPVTATSGRSITSFPRIAGVGDFDLKTLELRFAPSGYQEIPKAFPDARIVLGPDATAADWPFLLPGPGDAWAGKKAYSLKWTFRAKKAPKKPALALWAVDTTSLGGKLDVKLGSFATSISLPKSSSKGSRQGDATKPNAPLKPVPFELPLPAGSVVAGDNTLELTLSAGGWIAWDAVGVFDIA